MHKYLPNVYCIFISAIIYYTYYIRFYVRIYYTVVIYFLSRTNIILLSTSDAVCTYTSIYRKKESGSIKVKKKNKY